MEIEVHNVAKVREAKICLDRIAVVAGPNGSGKSTIAKGVLTLRDTLRSLPYYVAYKKASDLLKTFFGYQAKREVIFPSELSFAAHVRTLTIGLVRIEQPELLCRKSFWENDEEVFNYFSSYYSSRQANQDNQEHEAWIRWVACDDYVVLKNQILDWLCDSTHSDEAYSTFVISNAIKRVYCGQVNLLGADTVPSLTLHETNKVFTVHFEEGNYVQSDNPVVIDSDTYYLEPCHILDELAPNPYQERELSFKRKRAHYGEVCTPSWWDFAFFQRDLNPTMEEVQSQEMRNTVLGDISGTLNGQLTKQNRMLVFEDRSVNGQIYIPNMASGMKSMALIARAIENGWIRERDLLIIDEPESNLHPEWQVRFAEWLVELSDKLGLRLLLNTHSPYFLRAIERFCGRESMIGKLHVYLMEQDHDAHGDALPTFSAHDVTNDIGQVYRAMAKPFEEIE